VWDTQGAIENANKNPETCTLFVWLISHQPAVLFSQNKPVIDNQPIILSSQNKSTPVISHRPKRNMMLQASEQKATHAVTHARTHTARRRLASRIKSSKRQPENRLPTRKSLPPN
jgi:hypothetical protein